VGFVMPTTAQYLIFFGGGWSLVTVLCKSSHP
jgi:hypothetical protein